MFQIHPDAASQLCDNNVESVQILAVSQHSREKLFRLLILPTQGSGGKIVLKAWKWNNNVFCCLHFNGAKKFMEIIMEWRKTSICCLIGRAMGFKQVQWKEKSWQPQQVEQRSRTLLPCRGGRTLSWLAGSWTDCRICSIPRSPSEGLCDRGATVKVISSESVNHKKISNYSDFEGWSRRPGSAGQVGRFFWPSQSNNDAKQFPVFSWLWQKCSKTPRCISECQVPVMHV